MQMLAIEVGLWLQQLMATIIAQQQEKNNRHLNITPTAQLIAIVYLNLRNQRFIVVYVSLFFRLIIQT